MYAYFSGPAEYTYIVILSQTTGQGSRYPQGRPAYSEPLPVLPPQGLLLVNQPRCPLWIPYD